MRSFFVHNPRDLHSEVPGGVQICSREFLEIVQAASSATELIAVTISRNAAWRVRRHLGLGSYLLYHPLECEPILARALEAFQPTHVFLNKVELMRLAPIIKRLRPEGAVVLMSHGNQSGDDLYEIAGPAGRNNSGLGRLKATWQLGQDIATESYFRHRWADAVCVMSSEEEVLERWLGARKVVVLPRVIRPAPLNWTPVGGRVGYVGTLDHTPNKIALETICEQIIRQNVRGLEIRLVGKPAAQGEAMANRFSFVKYLGPLDNEALKTEASGWCLFLNPVFWLARGASMKLGQALAWGLPVLSTRSGKRGYQLDGGQLSITEDDPLEFVQTMSRILQMPDELKRMQSQAVRIAASSPTSQSLGKHLAAHLEP